MAGKAEMFYLDWMEQVAIVDALNVINGRLPVYMWDATRRDAADRAILKLRPSPSPEVQEPQGP